MSIVLASGSAARAAMLSSAGVAFAVDPARVDEDAAKAALAGATPRDLADALAELKALSVSARRPGATVIGSDSVVAADDGTTLDKPRDRAEAAAQLARLSGTRHRLYSAAVIARDGIAVWRAVDVASLTMRAFDAAFVDRYLDAEWPAIGACVGGYRIEGRGVQLFARIDGSHFTILGLPLLALLDQLRQLGDLP